MAGDPGDPGPIVSVDSIIFFLLLAKCYSFIVTFFGVIGFSGLPRTHGTPRTIRKTCEYIVVYS